VKYGGHITSITKRAYKKIPFYFQLDEKFAKDHVTKRAIFNSFVEQEEQKDRTQKMTSIKHDCMDKKALEKDY